jgi:hypothetical protein
MKVFLGTVLSLIAAGVLLTAYGLLAPRATASAPMAPITMTSEPLDGSSQLARPIYASEPGAYGYGGRESIDRPGRRAIYQGNPVNRARSMRTDTPPATRVAVDRGRDWKRTAMVIGGSTAAGAGLGAIFGGKKGALIGAALGGGASTIYEVRRR